MKKILIVLMLLFVPSIGLTARTPIAQLTGSTTNKYADRSAVNTQLANAELNFVELYAAGTGGGYTNLTSFVDQTAWRVFYSNTAGDVTELALGSDGTYLKSNGATSAPTWATPSGTMSWPAAAGIAVYGGSSAWGTSLTLDTDLASVSSSDDSVASAKATKALFDTLPAITWGTGLLNTSGTITGKGTVGITVSKATTYTIGTDSASESYGGTVFVTSATTITAPAVAAGMNFAVVTIGNIAVSLDVNASDKMVLDGVTLADGDKATNSIKAGDTIVCQYYSADGWYCWSSTVLGGHWTDGN